MKTTTFPMMAVESSFAFKVQELLGKKIHPQLLNHNSINCLTLGFLGTENAYSLKKPLHTCTDGFKIRLVMI